MKYLVRNAATNAHVHYFRDLATIHILSCIVHHYICHTWHGS